MLTRKRSVIYSLSYDSHCISTYQHKCSWRSVSLSKNLCMLLACISLHSDNALWIACVTIYSTFHIRVNLLQSVCVQIAGHKLQAYALMTYKHRFEINIWPVRQCNLRLHRKLLSRTLIRPSHQQKTKKLEIRINSTYSRCVFFYYTW